MRAHTVVLATLLLLPLAAPAPVAAQDHGGHDPRESQRTPYAGLEDRPIKALSDDEVQGLVDGEGMGFALAAELNGYPGPLHVLELAGELDLTPAQHGRVEEIQARMKERARALGARILEGERKLDEAFAAGTITAPALREETRRLGELRGELRGVHLAAHLEVTALLTGHQRNRYGELRGYGHASPEPDVSGASGSTRSPNSSMDL